MIRRSTAGLLALLLSVPSVLLLTPPPAADASRGNQRYEICHRTNSLTNPYRRISVAWAALSAHEAHTGPVFDLADPRGSHRDPTRKWGDVFEAVRGTGNGNVKRSNWTDEGRAVFGVGGAAPATFTLDGATRQACRGMTTIDFLASEEAAGTPLREIMQDLDQQAATDDLALRTALGGAFTTWYDATPEPRTLETITAGLEARSPSASTDAATDVTGTSATLRGTVQPQGATTTVLFEWGTDPALVGAAAHSAGMLLDGIPGTVTSSSTPVAVQAPLAGLLPGTTYYYRLLGSVSSGTGDAAADQDVLGAIRSFTVGEEPPVEVPPVEEPPVEEPSVEEPPVEEPPVEEPPVEEPPVEEPPTAPLTPRTLTLVAGSERIRVGASTPLAPQVSQVGGDISLALLDPDGACSLDGPRLLGRSAGACQVVASVTATAQLAAATSAPVTVTVTARDSQAITFAPLADRVLDGAPIRLDAAADSGLPVTVESRTPRTCVVDGYDLLPLVAGTCTLVASQGGDADTAPATDVVRSFRITPAQPPTTGPVAPAPTPPGPIAPTPPGPVAPLPPGPVVPLPPRPIAPTPATPGPATPVRPTPDPTTVRPTPTAPTDGGAATGGSARPTAPVATVPTTLAPIGMSRAPGTQRGTARDGGSPAPATLSGAPGATSGRAGTEPSARTDRAPGDRTGTARRSLRELAREPLAGFARGSSVTVDVSGARTAGQFLLSTSDTVDVVAIAAAIRDSLPRHAADFAQLERVEPWAGPGAPALPSLGSGAEDRRDLFAQVGLDTPRTLAELAPAEGGRWLEFRASVDTYQPGSTVYLAVTTQPIVLAEAVVDRHGRANIDGVLPLDVLAAGGHRLRVVGTRVLGGVTADDDGRIHLADETLAEIARFDRGTQATVTVSGVGVDGGHHEAVRVVPLLDTAPWWTVWLAAGVAGVATGLRRRGHLRSQRRRLPATVLVLAAGAPAFVLGWFASAWAVMGLGTLAAIVGAVLCWVLPQRPTEDEVEAIEPTAAPPLVGV